MFHESWSSDWEQNEWNYKKIYFQERYNLFLKDLNKVNFYCLKPF